MTEDEAKTKWCPMFRRNLAMDPKGIHHEVTNNRDNEDHVGVSPHCIGSGCMAWRDLEPEPQDTAPDDEDTGTVITFVFVPNGYCGLAGEPD